MKKLLLIIAFVLLLGNAVFANKVIVFNFGESDLNSDFNAASPEYGADITVYADQGYDVQSHGTCDAAYLVCNKVLEYLVSHPESTAAQLKQQIISQADLTTKFLPYTNIYR